MKNRKPYGYANTLDPSLLRSLYFKDGVSQRGIAKRFGLGAATVHQLFDRLGIRKRGKKEQKRYRNAILLDALHADRLYADGMSVSDLSEWADTDVYSIRCYLVDKCFEIRTPGQQRALTFRRNREACEERKKAGVREATFYIAGEKIVVKYDEEGRELA